MVEIWFAIAVVMIGGYVVLDGFDFGAGALHLFVARNDTERRQVLAAIGPYWDGNEVWLLASGGVLFLAFPKVLASGLSGFYFAIFLVLWALILRGIAIEFRSHVEAPLWRAAWDAVFGVVSLALPLLFGAALGNLVRGVPLSSDGWFTLALFTDFSARPPVGILDWYTIAAGAFAVVAIVAHGATFLVWKTDAAVQARSRRAAITLYAMVAILWPLLTVATWFVNRPMLTAAVSRPLSLLALLVAVAGLAAVAAGLRRRRELMSFAGSAAFILGILAATAASIFPVMLRAIPDEALSLTAYNASAGPGSLRAGMWWWPAGFALALVYLATLFALHRGKAAAARQGEGY